MSFYNNIVSLNRQASQIITGCLKRTYGDNSSTIDIEDSADEKYKKFIRVNPNHQSWTQFIRIDDLIELIEYINKGYRISFRIEATNLNGDTINVYEKGYSVPCKRFSLIRN